MGNNCVPAAGKIWASDIFSEAKAQPMAVCYLTLSSEDLVLRPLLPFFFPLNFSGKLHTIPVFLNSSFQSLN